MSKKTPLSDDSVIKNIPGDSSLDQKNGAESDRTVLLPNDHAAGLGGDSSDRTVLLTNYHDGANRDLSDRTMLLPDYHGGPDGDLSDRTALLLETDQTAGGQETPPQTGVDFDGMDFSHVCLNCFKGRGGGRFCPHCGWEVGSKPEQAYHLHPGSKLDGRYIIGTVIGFGGFGTTYRAWDAVLGIIVAVKEFFPARLVSRIPGDMKVAFFSGEKETQYHEQLGRYLDEARNLAKFSECPYIVKVLRHFEANNTAYIVMEYLDGMTLKDYARNEDGEPKALDANEAIRILEPVTHALELIHKSGIIHRDVSPDNIFITTDGQVKLLDFGAARLSKNMKDIANMAVIKPGYAPPEQYRTKSDQGPYTDVYGLGATLYRALTGIVPVESVDRAEGPDPLEKPSQTGAKIKPNLEKTVMTAMALEPSLRFRSMKEFRDAILDKKNVDLPEETRKKRRRNRRASLIAAVFILAASFTAYGAYAKYRPIPLSETVPEPDTISVWIPTGTGTNYDMEIMRDLADRFGELYAGVSVELVPVGIDDYNQSLAQAFEDKSMPALYFTEAEGIGSAFDALPLDDVVRSLDMESYPLFDRYGDIYPNRREIPLSYEVSMVYANQNAAEYNQAALPEEILGLDGLREGMQWDVQDGCHDSYFSLFGGVRRGSFNEGKVSGALDALLDARSSINEAGSGLTPMERFQNDELTYLFASTSHLLEISQNMAGVYKPLAVSDDSVYYGTFHDTWAVSSQATRNQSNIAKLFLIYMLSDYAQERLYIENTSWIPVNGEAFSNYLAVFSELAFLEEHLPEIAFNGENSVSDRTVGAQFEEKLKSSFVPPPDTLREELWDILLQYKD